MKKFKYLSLLAITLFLASCRDVVELDVEAAAPELVVNGELSDKDDLFVQLQSTAGFFDNSAFEAISNARVSILEDGQEAVILQESDSVPGRYESNFRGTVNKEYQLRIEIGTDAPDKIQGTWLSKLDTLRPVPEIDSVKQATLSRNTIPQAFFEGEYAVMFFGDFVGEGNRYRFKRQLNDSVFAQENFLISDEDFDGIYFGQGLFPPIAVYGPFEDPEPGELPDTLIITIQSVSKDFESYLNVLQSQVQTGSPFDAPPAMVIGNIYNADNPKQTAFGYFQTIGINRNGIRYRP